MWNGESATSTCAAVEQPASLDCFFTLATNPGLLMKFSSYLNMFSVLLYLHALYFIFTQINNKHTT